MNVSNPIRSISFGRSKFVGRLASQNSFAFRFPVQLMCSTCSGSHVSNVVDRTCDTCTPKLRWIPLHCMQMKMPKFTLAHRGPLHPQSAQCLLHPRARRSHHASVQLRRRRSKRLGFLRHATLRRSIRVVRGLDAARTGSLLAAASFPAPSCASRSAPSSPNASHACASRAHPTPFRT